MKIRGTITGTYEKNGFHMCFLNCGDKTIRVIGNAGKKGDTVEISGEFENSPKYGRQFVIMKQDTCQNEESIRAFFSSSFVPGAGKETAGKLCDYFGEETYDIVMNHQERISEIDGFGTKKAEILHSALVEYERYLPLISVAPTITQNQADKLLKKYGPKAVEILKKDPYKAMGEIERTGFLSADKLAHKSGWGSISQERVKAAIVDTLTKKYNETGDCYVSMQTLVTEIMERLNPIPVIKGHERATKNACADWSTKKEKFIKMYSPSEEEISAIDTWDIQNAQLTTMTKDKLTSMMDESSDDFRIINDNGDIYLKELYLAECYCARYLAQEIQQNTIRYIDKSHIDTQINMYERENSIILAPMQRKAVYTALMNRISITTGGPGCGKTTIERAMCAAWNDDESLVLAAPTGRAAKRMSAVSHQPAYTVHRLCGKKLENKFLIIDECSMLDVLLMERFLKGVKNCNITFTGDAEQLSSVGNGQFLYDIIQSQKIPKTVLDEGFRNSGSIALNRRLISEGKLTSQYMYDEHFKFTKCSKATLKESIIKKYKEYLKDYSPEDVVILLPTRKGNGMCVNTLNPILQDVVNTDGERISGTPFRVGDRVMQIKNDYSMIVQRGNERMSGVFNGDTGKIFSAGPEGIKVFFDDGWIAEYTKDALQNLELAYAQTVHKAQGSEYPVVIYACGKEHFFNLKRSLFYTAETRAQEAFHMIGECWQSKNGRETNVFDVSVLNTKDKMRNTKLSERIHECIKETPLV